MLGARGQVDAEALAVLVQRIAGARNFPLAISIVSMARDSGMAMAGARQFGIDEFYVEAGIADHQRCIADKGQKLLGHPRREEWLVAENLSPRPWTRWDSIGTSRSGLR